MNRVRLFLMMGLLCAAAVLLPSSHPASAAPAQAVVDWRFGVVEAYENPGAASSLGAGWTRVKFQWATVQQGGPGTWTASVSDAQINNEIAAGRTVVGLLIGIPDWAREGELPRGLHLPHNDPNNTWGVFVREAVARYNGRINHWIIWNEPDINDPNAVGRTWGGSINDFFQLQRTAYLVAKETNPNSVIHLAAFTHFWDPNYIYNFMDIVVADPAAPDNNYYFDAITAHLYFQPDSIFNLIQSFYGAVGSRGIPWKPLWLVETNAPPIDDPAWPVPNHTFVVTQDEQAAFVPQALASALAAGAQRIAVYKLQDTPGDVAANPEPFGLLRMDGSRRPAFTTYQVAIQYMAGMQGVNRERWDAVGQIRLAQSGYSTTVLFSRLPAPQQATVAATADTAVLVDMWGQRRSIAAQDGVFTVDLAGALCHQTAGDYCMIGGSVLYLVQATDGAAPGAPPPPAPPSSGAPATDTPDPDATQAATAVSTAEPTSEPTIEPTVQSTETAMRRPTVTPKPTNTATREPTATATATAVPATEVAAVLPTPQPTAVPPAAAPTSTLSYWLIGVAALLGLGLGTYWLRSRT